MSLAKLLDLSRMVEAFHEPAPHLRDEAKPAYAEVWEDPIRFAQVFERARSSAILKTSLKSKLYAETYYRMTFFAPVIAEMLPKSRFLHLHRHPGDVVRSGMRRRYYLDNGSDVYRVQPLPHDSAYAKWNDWDAFAKTCWYWHAINEWAFRFRARVDTRRVLSIGFEDLFNADTGVCQALFSFLNIECPPEEAVRGVLQARFNEQTAGDFPKYDEWSDQQRKTLREIAGDTAERLGYELR